MTKAQKYIETFINEYGESWWFDYVPENDMGIIWSNDSLILGDKFYVFNGIVPPLILNQKEKDWILQVWNKYSNKYNEYLNIHTSCKNSNICTYLENEYCPICLKQKKNFETHHCIPASEGGSDDIVNKLAICKSCHSLITNGCDEDVIPRHLACIHHQIFVYGVDFYLMNPENNHRFGYKDIGLYKNRPHIKSLIDYYQNLTDDKKILFNNDLKQYALYYYKFNRSIVAEFIDNEDINHNERGNII